MDFADTFGRRRRSQFGRRLMTHIVVSAEKAILSFSRNGFFAPSGDFGPSSSQTLDGRLNAVPQAMFR
jgi:hypothetical protein